MDSALAIIGFYFTLIGFVSGLFFTRLDSWYGSVREFTAKVAVLRSQRAERDKFQDARAEMKGLESSRPFGSFVAVGLLMSALVLLSFFVPVDASELNPVIFVQAPLFVTVVAYWAGGWYLLTQGKIALEKVDHEISEARKG